MSETCGNYVNIINNILQFTALYCRIQGAMVLYIVSKISYVKGKTDMKKLVAAVLTAAMTAAAAAPALAYSFVDIEDESYAWAAPYIDDMYKGGYITGYDDGTFRPDNEVTKLECLALFARAMGSNNAENKKLLSLAHEDYDRIISNYSLSWGTDEIAYLMYKGVLTKNDLDTYLMGPLKNEPMMRYEAAVIITKALNGETAATNTSAIVLDYTDARDIPSVAVQYVNYVTKAGIMNGMDDGKFMPNGSVLRSQMAVMLSRTVSATDYSFFTAKITGIDEMVRNVNYKTSNGTDGKIVYTNDTIFREVGVATQVKSMKTGVQAVFTQSGNKLVSVDVLSSIPDETVVGTYSSYSNVSGTMYIGIVQGNETKSYECAKDVAVVYAGSPSTIRSFAKGDSVELSLEGGVVAMISGREREIEVKNVTIEDVSIGEDVKITISSADSEYDGQIYTVDSSVKVKKNGQTTDLSKIYRGDTATITLQYDVIKQIIATSSSGVVDGIISALTISSPNSSMTVNIKGSEKEYVIPNDVSILINDEKGTLYDFRVGDAVKITTESNAITKIVATSTQVTAGAVTGVVTGVNASYGFISVVDDNGQTTQVFCKDTNTTFVTAEGKSKKMNDIKVGSTVTARGSISNGAFVGSLVIIEAEAKK